MMARFSFLSLYFFLMSFSSLSLQEVYGVSQEKLQRAQKEMNRAREELDKYGEEYKEFLGQVTELEQKIAHLVEDEQAHQEKITELHASIQCLRDEQAQSHENLKKHHQNLSKVLSALRHLSSHSAAITLSATKSKSDMVHTGILLRQLLPYLKTVSCELRQQLSELGILKEKIQQTEMVLSETKEKVERERESLTHLLKEKKDLQKQTFEKKGTLEKEWHRLKEEISHLQGVVSSHEISLERKELKPTDGKKMNSGEEENFSFDFPVVGSVPGVGQVQSSYRHHKDFYPQGKGIILEAAPGEMVRAPVSGRLKAIGENSHGFFVKIEHNSFYEVICSGLESVFFPTQTWVKRGQIIGRVSESDPPGIYLDVRRHGHPFNPLSMGGKKRTGELPRGRKKGL